VSYWATRPGSWTCRRCAPSNVSSAERKGARRTFSFSARWILCMRRAEFSRWVAEISPVGSSRCGCGWVGVDGQQEQGGGSVCCVSMDMGQNQWIKNTHSGHSTAPKHRNTRVHKLCGICVCVCVCVCVCASCVLCVGSLRMRSVCEISSRSYQSNAGRQRSRRFFFLHFLTGELKQEFSRIPVRPRNLGSVGRRRFLPMEGVSNTDDRSALA
jgi:hypothetical protein